MPSFVNFGREVLGPARSVPFRRFLLARSISSLGTAGTRVALVWYVLEDLGEPAWLGVVLIANAMPQFLVGLVAGALADRHSRRLIVVGAYLVSALAMLALWLLTSLDIRSLPLTLGLVSVVGACAAVLEPATWAVLPHLVDDALLRPASTLRTVADQLAQLIGPAAAGITVAAMSAPAWFIIDAVTFVLAAALFASISLPTPEDRATTLKAPISVIADLAGAARIIVRSPWLRAGIVGGALGNLFVVAPIGVAVPLIIDTRDLGAATFGWFSALLGAGTVFGALAANAFARSRPVERALVMLAGSGAAVAIVGLMPTQATILVLGFVLGLLLAIFEVLWNAHEIANLDDSVRAKVLAGDLWLSFALRTLGLAMLGAVAATSSATTMIVCGVALTVMTLGIVAQLSTRPPGSSAPTVNPSPS